MGTQVYLNFQYYHYPSIAVHIVFHKHVKNIFAICEALLVPIGIPTTC